MTQAELYAQLRELLIAARQTQGLTQVEVADRLGKPQSFVSKYESGERRLDVIELIEICRTLDVSPAALVTKLSGATESILTRWKISEAELSELAQQNPGLRGIMLDQISLQTFHFDNKSLALIDDAAVSFTAAVMVVIFAGFGDVRVAQKAVMEFHFRNIAKHNGKSSRHPQT